MSNKSSGGISAARVTAAHGASAAQVHAAAISGTIPGPMKHAPAAIGATVDPALVRIHDTVESLDGWSNGSSNYI